MSTAAGEGILGWLDTAITTAQADAEQTAGLGTCPNWGHCTPDCSHPDDIGTNNSASALRRCAADRKILALHAPQDSGSGLSEQCRTCAQRPEGDWYLYLLYYPCPTIVALAEGYGWTGGDR